MSVCLPLPLELLESPPQLEARSYTGGPDLDLRVAFKPPPENSLVGATACPNFPDGGSAPRPLRDDLSLKLRYRHPTIRDHLPRSRQATLRGLDPGNQVVRIGSLTGF